MIHIILSMLRKLGTFHFEKNYKNGQVSQFYVKMYVN